MKKVTLLIIIFLLIGMTGCSTDTPKFDKSQYITNMDSVLSDLDNTLKHFDNKNAKKDENGTPKSLRLNILTFKKSEAINELEQMTTELNAALSKAATIKPDETFKDKHQQFVDEIQIVKKEITALNDSVSQLSNMFTDNILSGAYKKLGTDLDKDQSDLENTINKFKTALKDYKEQPENAKTK